MGSRVETPTWLGSSHQWPWWRSPPEVRTQLLLLQMLPESPRSTTTSTTTTGSHSLFLSTPTTPLTTLSTFWVVTLPGIWLVASSQHLDPDLQSLLSQGGRAIHPARSSWIGSLKVSTSTSGLSRAEPTRLLLLDLCVMRENVQFLLCIF